MVEVECGPCIKIKDHAIEIKDYEALYIKQKPPWFLQLKQVAHQYLKSLCIAVKHSLIE